MGKETTRIGGLGDLARYRTSRIADSNSKPTRPLVLIAESDLT